MMDAAVDAKAINEVGHLLSTAVEPGLTVLQEYKIWKKKYVSRHPI
jgi:hypothetical protein